ncbi:hypothetical protein [Pseudofrankia asymbiotica]|uniref:Uncharacterized protein n=1 Tax=Pseudofrankia asymbiotica TaxID=1834516 RepID=A0A1V2IKK9_9ACTN|nr:hypothetical protein [Pseudofrankia asymbiotica]ONH33647.1 hypothetical protein BL253_01110 [Pseudofrankia asymbiotica]
MTARLVVVGTAEDCADVIEILSLCSDVRKVEIGAEQNGWVCVTADVQPDRCGRLGLDDDEAPVPTP